MIDPTSRPAQREQVLAAVRGYCHGVSGTAVQVSFDGVERIYYAGLSLPGLVDAVSAVLSQGGSSDLKSALRIEAKDRYALWLVLEWWDGLPPSLRQDIEGSGAEPGCIAHTRAVLSQGGSSDQGEASLDWMTRTQRPFHDALKKYPDAFEALHFLWNESRGISAQVEQGGSSDLLGSEYAWLIETGDHKYWNGKAANSNGFTHIADDAVRFARFEDSERIIYWLMESYKVFLVSRQHKFIALRVAIAERGTTAFIKGDRRDG